MSDDEERIDVETDDLDRNSQLSPHMHVDKRAHHNALERKRRDHIKDSFHHLRDTVPHLEGEKISRAQILNKATDFIKEMRHSTTSSECLTPAVLGMLQADIEELRRGNVVLEEQVKALEDVKSNGGCSESIDTLLITAEKRAIEKLNSASKGPSRTLPHGQLVGGMAGPHDMKPTGITGSGLVLNALTTSRGLSQLVNSVTPSDHSYTSALSGLPGASAAHFKPELVVTQPSAMKSSVRSSLAALSSSLRGGGQPLSLSTSTTVGAQTQTRISMPFSVGQQAKLPSATLRGVSPVIVKTPPVVTSSSLPRGIVTATAVPPMAAHSAAVPHRTSSADQKLTSAAVASALLAPSTVSSASGSALLPQPSLSPSSSSSAKSPSSNVLQTLLAANPLELNTALQNLLLTAANSSSSTLTDAQKTLINTLVAITSGSGSADVATGPGGASGSLATLQRLQTSAGPAAAAAKTGVEAVKVTVDPSPEESRGPVLDPQDLLSPPPLQPSSQLAEEEVDVLGEEGDLPPSKRPKQQ